ncbi:alkaline phosphatase [Alteribacillus sp. YIM 98480]|uniref:alkaline phosphatase n=1 Tax=Alteribacillus sp. YIM 98480 TaxID=2606599 RepID=UPI0021075758|nr:alkaline phosphatase [Alteribacillus sp. YIM 98480]
MKSIHRQLRGLAVLGMGATLIFATGTNSTLGVGNSDSPPPHSNGKGNEKVENVIYMIPDGFDANYATNYRHYKEEGEPVWDNFLTGMMKTESADNKVTDSAAAGTAMATGEKTDNGMISMTPDGEELESVLNQSEEAGMSTGLVATSTITHATPAVFGANIDDRDKEAEIAPQLIDNVDVLLGGTEHIPS